MPLSLEQFTTWLVESRLFSADELASVYNALAPKDRPETAESLALFLVRLGKLTKYQTTSIFQGQHQTLVLGDYMVLDKLGAGGMGVVYKAQHRRMKRIVALKVLPTSAMRSEENVQRFYREVEAAARLNHPNIVTAYDASEHNGMHYLAMEFVDGRDLSAILTDHGQLPLEHALDYVLQAARGLAYAHDNGVVHRDIKPGNLLVDRFGVVKILDMGLARLNESVGDAGMPQLTQTGQMMGTVDYMSPEQAEDTRHADHRSDIYALGCTLYRLLVNQPPFKGDTLMKKLLAHRDHPIPSLRAVRPDVPARLDAIYQTMLAKKPERRQQKMVQVIAELEAVQTELIHRPGGDALTISTGAGGTSAPPRSHSSGVGVHPVLTQTVEETINPTAESDTGGAFQFASLGDAAAEQTVDPARLEAEATWKSAVYLKPRKRWPIYVAGILGAVLVGSLGGWGLILWSNRGQEDLARPIQVSRPDGADNIKTPGAGETTGGGKAPEGTASQTGTANGGGSGAAKSNTSGETATSGETKPARPPEGQPVKIEPKPDPAAETGKTVARVEGSGPSLQPTLAPLAGPSLDLAGQVQVAADALEGAWQAQGGRVSLEAPGGVGRLAFPTAVEGNYRVRLKFSPGANGRGLGVLLPLSGDVQAFLGVGGTSVLGAVQGHSVTDKANPTRRTVGALQAGKTYVLDVWVKQTAAEVTIKSQLDGQLLIDWTGKRAEIASEEGWKTPDAARLGLTDFGETPFTVSEARLQMTDSGMCRLLRAPAGDAAGLPAWARYIASSAAPEGSPIAPKPPPKVYRPEEGWIDLLDGKHALAEFSSNARVEASEGFLVVETSRSAGPGLLAFERPASKNYELEVECSTKTLQGRFLSLSLPLGDTAANVYAEASRMALDHRIQKLPYQERVSFQSGLRYLVRVVVLSGEKEAQVRVFLGDREVITCRDAFDKLKLTLGLFPDDKHLGIGSVKDQTVIHGAHLREVDDKGQPVKK